jgi:hypothetical protein
MNQKTEAFVTKLNRQRATIMQFIFYSILYVSKMKLESPKLVTEIKIHSLTSTNFVSFVILVGVHD